MLEIAHQTYSFDEFTLDLTRGCLYRGDYEVKLRPKSFRTLVYLVTNSNRLVSKDEIIRAVWNEQFVTDDSLVQCLKEVRRALADGEKTHIRTVPRRGYIFEKEVSIDLRNFEGQIDKVRDFTQTGSNDIPRNSQEAEPIKVLAILPLKNLTGDSANDYLVEGLSEGLIANLSGIRNITLIARSSGFVFKGMEYDIADVGQYLGADTVFTGAVQKEDEFLRVGIRLVSVKSARVIWAKEIYKRVTEIFELQNEITRSVVAALSGGGADCRLSITPASVQNDRVYDLYLRARFYWSLRNTDSVRTAIRYFQQVNSEDPDFAPAYAGMADCYLFLASNNHITPAFGYANAKDAVCRALAIDETLAEAHPTLARIKTDFEWDWEGAESEFKRAIELDPNSARSYHWYGKYLAQTGRFGESIWHFQKARKLDPLSITVRADYSLPFFLSRQYDLAIEYLRDALEMDPNRSGTYLRLGLVYEQKGLLEEALVALTTARRLDDTVEVIAALAHAYAVMGATNQARKILAELLRRSQMEQTSHYEIATVYSGLGQKEEAFEWLFKAYEFRSASLPFLMVDPSFKLLRTDIRLPELARRIGFPS